MNVKNIVEAALRQGGFDGLYSERWGCGCRLDDLAPCELEGIEECVPGHLAPCDPEYCEADGECGWHIEPKGEGGQ